MKHPIGSLFFLGFVTMMGASCGSGDLPSEPLGTHDDLLTKCQEMTPGDSNFCNDPNCKCILGEGDCDNATHCIDGLICSGKGTYFGYAVNLNVCAGPHCNNKVLDGDETQVDCGGSCGTNCPVIDCSGLPPNGSLGHCTADCRCPALEGGCTAASQCLSGACTLNHGMWFGFAKSVGACTAPHCTNMAMDGDETGLNCGGSCAPCPGAHIASASYGSGVSDRALDFTFDAMGNMIVAGTFSQTINFGTLPATALTSNGGTDIFVAKFDSAGNHVWSKGFGNADNNDGDQAVVVATDNAGNVHLGGNYYDGADFGEGPEPTTDAAPDGFVVKLAAATGNTIWVRTYGGTRTDRVTGLSVTSSGTVFVAGSFTDSVSLGGSTLMSANGTANVFDMFVGKLNSGGNHLWSKGFGSTGDDQATDVTSDGAGNVIVAGVFSATVDFGKGPILAAGNKDGVLFKTGPSGGLTLWVRQFGGNTNNDLATSVSVGANQHPVVTGAYVGTFDFGEGPVTAAGTDMYAVSCDAATGATRWANTGGGTALDRGIGVAVDKVSNDVAIVGLMTGSADFGGGAVSSGGASTDVFIARYLGADGAHVWSAAYGGATADVPGGVSSFDGVLAMAGRFTGSFSFGGAALPNAGGIDVFLARYKY